MPLANTTEEKPKGVVFEPPLVPGGLIFGKCHAKYEFNTSEDKTVIGV